MVILALDTSGDSCSVAVARSETVLVTYHFRHERRLSERLNGTIDFVLRDAGVSLAETEAIAVGVGPGSFTGVRVGVTLAKTLALVREIPVLGVSSLNALVEPVAALTGNPIVAAVPTRRTESIAAFFTAGSVEPVLPPAVYANDTLMAVARQSLGDGELLLLGEAATSIRAVTPDRRVIFRPAFPGADAVARLAAPRLILGESDDVETLVPRYVAPTPVG
ncbi:MAG: tRNA (adenosine(37)-N6)-threonylcarbamoyltransferase complex dimerization subunit type 1 TsaB [Capsulimonadales bacterium]|nr:tRNA (adenosine(37)-N6)-threonylcarbamoyltransferase complex dimerization subunit type 1 TsaB [Capsulimonadales bacterium]